MKPIITTRKGIPFFHQKTALEFQQDDYERYEEMVVRQSGLHLADKLWDRYPFQPVFDFSEKHYPKATEINILEIGCGVGRWIGSLATRYPKAHFWGIDYSYQMLKRAHEFWVQGKEISINLADKGFDQESVLGEKFNHLKFGLAKAENLPFDEDSQDLILSSFMIDRLEDPIKGIQEIHRVLKPNKKLIVLTPLNFKRKEHWELYYPPIKISKILKEIGFEILDWKENIVVNEPLDLHGNEVRWNCLGFVVKKN